MKYLFLLIIFLLTGCGEVEKKDSSNVESTLNFNESIPETKEVVTSKELIDIPKEKESVSSEQPIHLEANLTSKGLGIPTEFKYTQFVPSDFCQKQSHCYDDKIYPIGWSSKGHIAYINEHPPNNVGTIFKFIIQDMVSDDIIWSKRWVEEAENLQQLWSNNKTEINQKLEAYNISQNSQILELKEFPIEINNEDYSISFSETHDDNGLLNRQKLFIKSMSLGKKKIYDKKIKTHGGLGLSQSKIIGAFKSPYEDRVAILKLNEINQIEGDKELRLEFIGSYLKK